MRLTTYALMAAAALTAAATVPAVAQQGDQTTLRVVIVSGKRHMRFDRDMSPIMVRFSFDKPVQGPSQAHKDDRGDHAVNSKAVKLETVHIVVPRENPSPRNK